MTHVKYHKSETFFRSGWGWPNCLTTLSLRSNKRKDPPPRNCGTNQQICNLTLINILIALYSYGQHVCIPIATKVDD